MCILFTLKKRVLDHSKGLLKQQVSLKLKAIYKNRPYKYCYYKGNEVSISRKYIRAPEVIVDDFDRKAINI